MSTSITKAQAKNFVDTAKPSKELHCSNITGFHLRKNNKGASWRLNYQDANKKRRRVTIGGYPAMTPIEAAQIAAEWHTGIKKGEADPLTKREELAALQRAQEQEQAQSQYKLTGRFFKDVYQPHLIENYRTGHEVANKIKNFEFLFDRDMDAITPHDIDSWYKTKRKAGLKRDTLAGYLGAFKAMLNFAAGTKKGDQNSHPVISFNPLRDYSLPRPTKNEREEMEIHEKALFSKRDIFSDEVKAGILAGLFLYAEELRAKRRRSLRLEKNKHLQSLDNVTYPHWFIPYCHIARLTGMRPSDVRSLDWSQLDHNQFNGRTTLEFIPQKTKDKGEKPTKVRFPVDGELLDVLTKWREQNGNPKSGFMFKSDRTAGAVERKAYLKHWAHVLKLGDLPSDIDFYSFRHNFISSLVRRNVPLIKIARLVGHANTDMIVKYYLRTDEEDMLDVATIAMDSWDSPEQSAAKVAGGEK